MGSMGLQSKVWSLGLESSPEGQADLQEAASFQSVPHVAAHVGICCLYHRGPAVETLWQTVKKGILWSYGCIPDICNIGTMDNEMETTILCNVYIGVILG